MLKKFAVNYDVSQSSTKCCSTDEGFLFEEGANHENIRHKNSKSQEIIKLKRDLGYMRQRKRESVLRTHKFKITSEPEKYYHSLLMLYYPWCNEEELKGDFPTYEEHYKNIKHIIDHNSQEFRHNTESIDNAFDSMVENRPPETSWDSVVPAIEEENIKTLKG